MLLEEDKECEKINNPFLLVSIGFRLHFFGHSFHSGQNGLKILVSVGEGD